MKQCAKTTLDPPHWIILDGLAKVSDAVAVNLPDLYKVRHVVRRYRPGNDALPANPQNRANIPVILKDFSVTSRGNRFLSYDSGVGSVNGILVFATDDALSLLRQSDH